MNPTVIFSLIAKLAPHIEQIVTDAQNTVKTVASTEPAHQKALQVIKDVEDVLGIFTGLL